MCLSSGELCVRVRFRACGVARVRSGRMSAVDQSDTEAYQ